MSNVLPDVRSVVKALGGPSVVAAAFDITEPAVFNWIMRGRFPAHTHFEMRDRLKAVRKTAPDELWKRVPKGRDCDLPQTHSAHQ